jgi:hypothetical protein
MFSSGNSFDRESADSTKPPQLGLLARVTGGAAMALAAFRR